MNEDKEACKYTEIPIEDAQKLLLYAVKSAKKPIRQAFAKRNKHLTVQEMNDLKQLKFPEMKPVFHGVKPKKDHHVDKTQMRAIDLNGNKKFFLHRAAAIVYQPNIPSPTSEASHLYSHFPNDFNPNNIRWESNVINQTRKYCRRRWDVLSDPGSGHYIASFKQRMEIMKASCAIVHNEVCRFWNPEWGVCPPVSPAGEIVVAVANPEYKPSCPKINRAKPGPVIHHAKRQKVQQKVQQPVNSTLVDGDNDDDSDFTS